MRLVDSHQHFWRYTPEEYGWIGEPMSSIRRDFLPIDLKTELHGVDFAGSVAVQARQSLEETRWLLQLAADYPGLILGVVGWAPLTSPQLESHLVSLTRNKSLKGLRHVIQGEPDDRFILREDFNGGIAQLLPFDLVYDILILERHLESTITFVDRHPRQIFVVDHIAKPKIKEAELQPWAGNLRELAKRANVFCKLSGLATEADYISWRSEDLIPYMDVVLEAFGPQRIMFGSDWPVCLVATTYRRWLNLVEQQIHSLTQSEQDAILGNTARRVYRLQGS